MLVLLVLRSFAIWSSLYCDDSEPAASQMLIPCQAETLGETLLSCQWILSFLPPSTVVEETGLVIYTVDSTGAAKTKRKATMAGNFIVGGERNES